MGSLKKPRITKATLDKKAESSFFTELQNRYESLTLEKEDLAKHVKSLLIKNEGLKNENKELKAQIKEWEKERDEVLRECVKLAKLVEELRDAIEEPKELDDK